jgi:hypothetical protein
MGIPLFAYANRDVGDLLFHPINIKRIIKEVTAAAPLYDLADPEAQMDYTIAARGV